MRLGDNNMMATYRFKLMNEFASGKYAGPVSQPDYEWNFRHMASLQDSLYNEAYKAYQQADGDCKAQLCGNEYQISVYWPDA